MEFREITIATTEEGIDIVTGALAIHGMENFIIEDPNDFKEFLETNTPRWDYIEESLVEEKSNSGFAVKLYLAENMQGAEQLETVRAVLDGIASRDEAGLFGTLEMTVGEVKEEDWAENWKKFFKPFPVGDRFYIKPSWEVLEDAGGRTVLEIDPGSSFGTGGHATTQLCIASLEKIIFPGARFCDLGCGSGILTIAAGLLGAGEKFCVDIDENAASMARQNLERAGISASIFVGDVTSDASLQEKLGTGYDVIAANIVADVLLAILPNIASMLKVGGKAVLSGIITERLDEILAAVPRVGLTVLSTEDKDDWASVLLEKH